MDKVGDAPSRVHLGKLLKGHENRWVALDDALTKVVAAADTPSGAIGHAKAKGFLSPIVLWAPTSLDGFQL